MIRIQEEPYDLAREVEEVRCQSSRTGAVVVFEGVAREFGHSDQDETWLRFECYRPMAEKKLKELENQTRAKFPILDIAIIHRIGPIDINEGIVLVVTSASHRQDAYQANQWCMDELKRSVPIWKKEVCSQRLTY